MNSLRIYAASNALSKIGMYLPFVVVVAFIFQGQVLRVIDPLFFSNTDASHFAILQDQYAFLSKKLRDATQEYRDQVVVGVFHLFDSFIWIASTVALLRVMAGACGRAVRDSYGDRLKIIENTGMSPFIVFIFGLIIMPLGMLLSLKFQLASHSLQLDAVMAHAPRFFLCLMTFLFCTSMYFFVEGLLMLFSLVF
jgi:hypothetical protein